MKRKAIFLWITAVVLILISALKITLPVLKDESVKDVIYKSVESIDASTAEFSFVVLGDNKNSVSTYGKIINEINKKPDIKFVMNTGDLVFDGSLTKFNYFLKQISKLNKPFLPVVGNHDVADGGMNNYVDFFGPLYYSFDVGEAYFIVLDDSNEEGIDLWQMNWLKNQLEISKRYKYTFVFLHVPLFDPRLPDEKQPGHSLKDVNNAAEILELLKKYDVTMIFAGHIHGYFKGKWDDVPYTITGGAGAELVGLSKEHYFYHYIVVQVNEKGVKYEVVKVDSPDFNIVDRLGAFLWLYLYSFVVINYWWIVLSIGLIIFIFLLSRDFKKQLIDVGNWLMKRKTIKFILKLFTGSSSR
ncbi:metallophosphoesterase [Kosmotoga arenicorallina S304]|uniref:Metallophosphoesterase n=1 Tax=Kosmotoga arenicorallina S304 TaxID=1453497 RepID=A0A176K0P7_9BACT|nr:metallophosphoesterase [Kosmotoga arenicorallina]OAA30040.1 metallophosphoesterase [Kosmotoga arenicorallina S304]